MLKFDIERFAGKISYHIKLLSWILVILILADNVLHIYPTDIRFGMRSVTCQVI